MSMMITFITQSKLAKRLLTLKLVFIQVTLLYPFISSFFGFRTKPDHLLLKPNWIRFLQRFRKVFLPLLLDLLFFKGKGVVHFFYKLYI